MPGYGDDYYGGFCDNCFIELIAVVFLINCLCHESIFGGVFGDD